MEVLVAPAVQTVIDSLFKGKKADPTKAKKVRKALTILGQDHRHPSLQSHRYEAFDRRFGESVWESYVEQGTPSAWRIWWFFGPGKDVITVVDLGPHP